jgi:Pentapeptide repeats (9 copies)
MGVPHPREPLIKSVRERQTLLSPLESRGLEVSLNPYQEPAMEIHNVRETLSVQDSDITESLFANAKLMKSRFDDVNLQRSAFTNTNLAEATFVDVNLTNVSINNANLSGMKIDDVLVSDLIQAYQNRRAK